MAKVDLVRVAAQYGFDASDFLHYVNTGKFFTCLDGLGRLDTRDVAKIVAAYREEKEAQAAPAKSEQERIADEQARIEEEKKQKALASMLITSGFSFEGYTITKYSGYISGDDAVQIDRGRVGFFSSATNVGDSLMAALVQIRRRALTELKEAAYALGCNAVIGVDFDYLTLDPETANSSGGTTYLPYVFGVTANGNAVVIEKKNTND